MTDNYKILGHMRDLTLTVVNKLKDPIVSYEAKLEVMISDMTYKKENGYLTKSQRDQLDEIVEVYENYKAKEKRNG